MVDTVMRPLSVGIWATGYTRPHYSCCPGVMNLGFHYECFGCNSDCSLKFKVGYRTKRKDPCVLSVTEGRYTCLRVTRLSTLRVKMISECSVVSCFQTVSCKVADAEYVSLSKSEIKPIPQEKELFDGSSHELEVPLLGSSRNQHDLVVQDVGVNRHMVVSERTETPVEDRLLFLEETNEEELSKRLLKLSRLNKVKSMLRLYKSMEVLDLQPNLHACNSMLSCLLRNGMFDDALKFFDVMRAREMTSGHSCSLILKAVAETWSCDTALTMFEELERDSKVYKFFDAVVYNTMISIFSKVNNWVQIESIWRRLQRRGCPGTTITYRLLICTFVRCNRNELALDAYQEMVQNGLVPGADAMHATIGACVKEGKWELALIVLQNMLESGLKPNLIACNALINSLGKSGKVKLAFQVYDLMKSFGHAPDAYTWNALLGSLNKANQHADALKLFESIIREQDSVLNVHIYNTVLMSCQKLGSWGRALQLLWQMEASGMSLSTATYNLAIGACETARQPKVALQIYDHVLQQKLPLDVFTLLSLIRCCIWGSLWEEVEEILNRYPPNASMYNAAIQGLCLRGKIDLAMLLYSRMNNLDLKPDGKTRALVLQNLRKDLRKEK